MVIFGLTDLSKDINCDFIFSQSYDFSLNHRVLLNEKQKKDRKSWMVFHFLPYFEMNFKRLLFGNKGRKTDYNVTMMSPFDIRVTTCNSTCCWFLGQRCISGICIAMRTHPCYLCASAQLSTFLTGV